MSNSWKTIHFVKKIPATIKNKYPCVYEKDLHAKWKYPCVYDKYLHTKI